MSVLRRTAHGRHRRCSSPGRASTSGFTLIEVMVAMSILAMVATLTWSSFRETIRTKETVEADSQRYHTVRLALERLSRELQMAFLSQNDDPTQAEKRAYFVGKRHGDLDEVRFSMFGHQRLYANANEGDTSQVAWFGASDRNASGRMNLLRRETHRMGNVKIEQAPGRTDVICEDVVRLQLDYWDQRDKTWREEWSTLAADGQVDRLPAKVKITLVVRDGRGNDVPFSTVVRLPMQEPLNLKPRTN